MGERDSKSIIRQWDREIEDEIRARTAADKEKDGPWKAVVWGALWAIWLALLLALFAYMRSLK